MNVFSGHTELTALGAYADAISTLPDDVSSLVDVVRGLFLHRSYVSLYGVEGAEVSSVSRDTLPLEKRLDQVISDSAEPLNKERPFEGRQLVTCRDYALMTCGLLREKQMPARVRCGFATYFHPDRYEDHWICEYVSSIERRWVRVDAQLDSTLCDHLGVKFDTLDLPSGAFLTAREAWASVRDNHSNATCFGHGDAVGEWFLWVNLARDYLALSGRETSSWDSWRDAKERAAYLDEAERLICNDIAERIEKLETNQTSMNDAIEIKPFWFTEQP